MDDGSKRGKTMRWESKTDPNKTICREGLDDKTRCLIKGGMSNLFLNLVRFLERFSSCRRSVFWRSLPDVWYTTYTPRPRLSYNLLTLSETSACGYNLTLLSNISVPPNSSDGPFLIWLPWEQKQEEVDEQLRRKCLLLEKSKVL